MDYYEKLDKAIQGLWLNFMEFTREHEFVVQYWGISYSPWSGGERAIKIIASYLNTEVWDEIMDMINKNGLVVRHWFMSVRHKEISILIWLALKEV